MLHDVGKLFLMQILTELAVDDPSIDLLADEEVAKFLFDHHAQFWDRIVETMEASS